MTRRKLDVEILAEIQQLENAMMKPLTLAGLGLAVIFGAMPSAQAQVTLDVSKVTCEQFSGYKITNPDNIALWLSGFYSGKRNNTIVDMQGLVENSKKILTYCIRNPQTPVMQAVETVLGAGK
jgi:hypothetical protein